jgi:magnesium-transporting ATPase (P-type)
MIFIARLLLSLIFLVLSVLHFYWATGGRWGIDESIPTDIDGKKTIKTGVLACIVVGSGLLTFALFYSLPFLNIELFSFTNFLHWVIPSIFLLRAIGDFKYVGFFKSVKATKFGQLDTRYYSPLCLVLAGLGFLIATF